MTMNVVYGCLQCADQAKLTRCSLVCLGFTTRSTDMGLAYK